MTYSTSAYILFQCKLGKEGLLIEKFNGVPNKLLKGLLKGFDGNIAVSTNVKIGINNLILCDTCEIIAKFDYSVHHGKFSNIRLKLYKFRGIKCTYGIKSIQSVIPGDKLIIIERQVTDNVESGWN